MPFRFRDFRQVLSFLNSLLSGMSLCVGIYLSKFFFRRGVVWLLLSVEVSSFLRSTWSGIRKPMFATPQSVASEAIGLFVLFPFQLIIALLLSSITPRPSMPPMAFIILRTCSVSGAILHMTYTTGLVAVAMLTVPSFDADVWLRDIDSSPSPFPMSVIFAYAFPWIARHFSATRPLVQDPVSDDSPSISCSPTCQPNCTAHNGTSPDADKSIRDAHAENAVVGGAETVVAPMVEMKRPPVLPHTLIRMPNAAERRSSIYVELHFSSRN